MLRSCAKLSDASAQKVMIVKDIRKSNRVAISREVLIKMSWETKYLSLEKFQ